MDARVTNMSHVTGVVSADAADTEVTATYAIETAGMKTTRVETAGGEPVDENRSRSIGASQVALRHINVERQTIASRALEFSTPRPRHEWLSRPC